MDFEVTISKLKGQTTVDIERKILNIPFMQYYVVKVYVF